MGSDRVGMAFRIAACAAVAVALASGPAEACGTLRDWVAKYDAAGESDRQRVAALHELTVACSDYAGKAHDTMLLPVLRDAVRRNLDRGLVQLVFDTYMCLPGVREVAGYAALASALDTSACLSEAELANWYESTVDGALLRRGPSRGAEPIGWLRKGAMAEHLGTEGEWIEVLTWTGAQGYVHASLLAPY